MEHLTYVLILTITTSLGAVSTQKEYANTYNNCVEHGMAWADTQRPLHPDDTISWDCKLADGEPHPDSPQSESAPPADTTPVSNFNTDPQTETTSNSRQLARHWRAFGRPLSFTTNAVPISSTDQGGGKRRLVGMVSQCSRNGR